MRIAIAPVLHGRCTLRQRSHPGQRRSDNLLASDGLVVVTSVTVRFKQATTALNGNYEVAGLAVCRGCDDRRYNKAVETDAHVCSSKQSARSKRTDRPECFAVAAQLK